LTDESQIEVVEGMTYELEPFGGAEDAPWTRVLAYRELGGGVWIFRDAGGCEWVGSGGKVRGPVEPLRPGVEKRCSFCGGSKVVAIDGPAEPDKPWLRQVIGHEPCPNCGDTPGAESDE